MTVTYTAEVATCNKFGCFLKLLFRWKGSIYKLVWMDLLLFLALYYTINLLYIYGLNDTRKKSFEILVFYCSSYGTLIPLSFVLGFYVSIVMDRWWDQYMTIPWPDSIAVYVSAHVQGHDEGARVMRRTIMRYVCVCFTMVFTMISPVVKRRFPKLQHLVDAGLLQENEKAIFDTINSAFPQYPKHWMPIVWATSIVARARKEGRIRDDYAVKTIIDALNSFRGMCGFLLYYDFITVPLVYTQVVTIAVYSFFMCSLIAHQWTRRKESTEGAFDYYMPVFIVLQFFFYMGWLKVAETLINPFGEDDDDFEVNWMIDRHLQVSYMIVDEMHHEHPELVKDQYWDEVLPNELPYDTDVKREKPPEYSTAKYDREYSINLARESIAESSNKFKRLSILSQRSEQFNQAFQRYGVSSSDASISLRGKSFLGSTGSAISNIETVHGIHSYIQPRRSNVLLFDEPLFYEPIPEEMHEEQPHEEDEYDKMVESRSGEVTVQSESSSDNELFERLRAERLQKRIKNMSDFLVRNFGPNFKLVYEEPTFRPEKSRQSERKASDTKDADVPPSPVSTPQTQPTFRLVPQKGLIPSERIPAPMATVATSPLSSASSLDFVMPVSQLPVDMVSMATSPMASAFSLSTSESSQIAEQSTEKEKK